MGKPAFVILCLLLLIGPLGAADWPMYRSDANRSGYTPEQLPARPSLRWAYKSPHPPVPAWVESGTRERALFDRVCYTVIADGIL